MTRPELSIIIVNWNGIEFLPACLRSIVENPPSVSYKVIVIDNASSDGSVEWLKSKQVKDLFSEGNLSLIESKENLGFGRGNNLAFESASGEFFFLLNPDTQVTAGAIDRLIEILHTEPSAGASVPKLLNSDGSLQPSTWYFPPRPSLTILSNFGIYKLFPKTFVARQLLSRHWAHDRVRNVPIAWCAAMMVRCSAMDELKGFDPAFHMYGEDVDLCVRLSKAGYSIVFQPAAKVTHASGGSSKQKWSQDDIHIRTVATGLIVEHKHLSRFSYNANILTSLIVESIRVGVNTIRLRSTDKSRRVMAVLIRGIFHPGQRIED